MISLWYALAIINAVVVLLAFGFWLGHWMAARILPKSVESKLPNTGPTLVSIGDEVYWNLIRPIPERMYQDVTNVRPSILAFAVAMERKLIQKEGVYAGWDKASAEIGVIEAHFEEEVRELREALAPNELYGIPVDMVAVGAEAVDVGNMVMMLWDRARDCPFGPRGMGSA